MVCNKTKTHSTSMLVTILLDTTTFTQRKDQNIKTETINVDAIATYEHIPFHKLLKASRTYYTYSYLLVALNSEIWKKK